MTKVTASLRHVINELLYESLLNEADYEDLQGVCMTRGSTHVMNTCYIGGDKFYLKFSDVELYDPGIDPSLQILVEWLAYKIYSLYPDVDLPGKIELVYDRTKKRVGLATLGVDGGKSFTIKSAELAQMMSAGVYVDIFLANWDVVGPGNVIINSSGRPVRIDPGGALTFRAQGSRKGSRFSDEPGEIRTMLTPGTDAGYVFIHSDLKVAAKNFMSVPWSKIEALINQCDDEVSGELDDRGMGKLLNQWTMELQTITLKLRKRHESIVNNVEFMNNLS